MPSNISQQRMQELLQLYQQLKLKVLRVNEKYSVNYVEPQLDFSPSLNLQPLDFTPLTPEQIVQQARVELDGWYANEQLKLAKTRDNKYASFLAKRDKIDENYRQISVKLATDYNEKWHKLRKLLIDNGLIYSSISDDKQTENTAQYNADVTRVTADRDGEKAIVNGEISQLQTNYQQWLQRLESQYQSKLSDKVSQLTSKQQTKQQAVQKYNNSLTEKEQKYQMTCKRALQYARQQESARALTAGQLFATLGAIGFEENLQNEKLMVVKTELMPLRRNEALTLAQIDGFLQTELGYCYDALITWINGYLPE